MGFSRSNPSLEQRKSQTRAKDTSRCALCHSQEDKKNLFIRIIDKGTYKLIALAHPEGQCT